VSDLSILLAPILNPSFNLFLECARPPCHEVDLLVSVLFVANACIFKQQGVELAANVIYGLARA
jgi:hypothetical protein